MELFDYSLPFIFYRLPGDNEYRFVDNLTTEVGCLRGNGIAITQWLDRPFQQTEVAQISTPADIYSHSVTSAAETARLNNGKVVIARQICGKFHNFAPISMAQEYFDMFPDMFCFLFYHPVTGYWMGASPELLVSLKDDIAYTRALAGTRRVGTKTKWDDKNIAEHNMVIDDIRSNIRELYPTWNCDVKETATLRYGEIEHLCTSIELHCSEKGSITVGKVAKALHPTAAVCGLPRDIAVKNIDRLEQFDRRFYAGLISTADTAYVILRCVHFDSNHWCIYSGSGITGQSVADDEWAETQAKAEPLISLLNKF